MPIRSTTHTCTVPSLDGLEHLLLQTAAALMDTTVDFVVAADNVAAADEKKVTLTSVTKDVWSTATTHTTALGWLGALRTLAMPDAVAESWLEATELTLVTIVRQGT